METHAEVASRYLDTLPPEAAEAVRALIAMNRQRRQALEAILRARFANRNRKVWTDAVERAQLVLQLPTFGKTD